MNTTELDPQAAFEETLAEIHAERMPKVELPKKAQARFAKGFMNLSTFKSNYNRVAAHAAYSSKIFIVTLGANLEPVFIVGPEQQLIVPLDGKFPLVDGHYADCFLSLSLPGRHALKYREEKLKSGDGDMSIQAALKSCGGEPLGTNIFWRREYPEAGPVIIAQYGTVKPRSLAPQPH